MRRTVFNREDGLLCRLPSAGQGRGLRRLDRTGLVWFGRMRNGPSLTVSGSRIDKDRTGVAEDLDLGVP
jgi:hypothetical protein